ncbi:MAG: MurT ligase domain-containing protein [Actinomycetota bacterium]
MSSSPQVQLARWSLRAVNFISRVAGFGSGTVIGGKVGLLLDPNLLAHLKPKQVVLVSGTNGKTTTTAMIVEGLGLRVTTNSTGANMPEGLAAALAGTRRECAVLEVDEAWLPLVASSLNPDVLVLLNLSRDQLDRANEVRQIAERWREVLGNLTTTKIVANANDPLVVYALERATRVSWCDVPTQWRQDATACPRCNGTITFSKRTWHCGCGFAKPGASVTVLDTTLRIYNRRIPLELSLPGEFNRVNAALALTAIQVLGADSPIVASVRISLLTSVAGRYGLRELWGRRTELFLAKNPAGFSALLESLPRDTRELWIGINAEIADGRDPSWLYDVPFELLGDRVVYCFGTRRLDLAARLFYAGLKPRVIDERGQVPTGRRDVVAVGNYTVFQEWLKESNPL